MMQSPTKPPVWVARPRALEQMAVELSKHGQIAIDTESNSLFAYKEQVCLIQISIPGTDYLVDPLALSDLDLLKPIFANPDIVKIFHAAEYDIICLKRDFGFEFEHIFDTMQAARILGRKDVGLANMLKNEFGIILEKKYQRANWGQRPLTVPMLAYARLDSYYLIDLQNRLAPELEEKGLLDLAKEDFQHLAHLDAAPTESQPPVWWRLVNGKELSAQQCASLQALLEYREVQARNADVPPFKILNNQTLIDIAAANPRSLDDLKTAGHLTQKQIERHGYNLLGALAQSAKINLPARPVTRKPSDAILARMDLLKNWRKETGRKLEVESDIILPREVMEAIAYRGPASQTELNEIMVNFPWRSQHFGEQILGTIQQLERT